MTKQITVNGKEIIVVSVPGDAYDFELTGLINGGHSSNRIKWKLTGKMADGEWLSMDAKYKIIGTCTADTIDFDCSSMCEIPYCGFEDVGFKNYQNEKKIFSNPNDSFRSLLTSHGFNFKNPEGEMPEYTVDRYYSKELSEEDVRGIYEYDLKMWREAENSLVHKVVIIEKL